MGAGPGSPPAKWLHHPREQAARKVTKISLDVAAVLEVEHLRELRPPRCHYASQIGSAGLHIAQVNVALARAPIDSPLMAEFVASLDPINALADASPGSVWRLQTEDGNATSIRAFDDDRVIVNLSVWESLDHLADFVYRSAHVDVMRRRREWFERIRLHMALWWVPIGHIPAVSEAQERLAHLREHGPTLYAFTFKSRFLPGEELVIPQELGCPT